MSLCGPQDKYRLNKSLSAGRQGFSLLETTIAIAIMVSAILGPMSISSQSIRSASVARNNIIASNLAQEGLELLKVYRHNNRIAGRPWTEGLETCFSQNGCRIDARDLNVQSCAAACSPFKFDDSLKLYNYSSGADTIFSRTINILNITANEIRITASVRWNDKFGDQFFNLETSIFDW